MTAFQLTARNTAPDSENRMHDDRVAAEFGFRGGLVPGVTVYGYVVSHLPREWREQGHATVRLLAPFYDGETVIVRQDGDLVAEKTDGTVCAKVGWGLEAVIPPLRLPFAPVATERPPASGVSLAPGTVLGSLTETLGDAEPERLLELANRILMRSVVLSPWIHAASEIQHHRAPSTGETVEVRGLVTANYERKGHHFVVYDVSIADASGPLASIHHTAIWKPRPSPLTPTD